MATTSKRECRNCVGRIFDLPSSYGGSSPVCKACLKGAPAKPPKKGGGFIPRECRRCVKIFTTKYLGKQPVCNECDDLGAPPDMPAPKPDKAKKKVDKAKAAKDKAKAAKDKAKAEKAEKAKADAKAKAKKAKDAAKKANKKIEQELIVRRDAASATSQTMLRKTATDSREGDVWVPSKTCVDNGAAVAVLRTEGAFSWVRFGAVEGFLQTKYLHPDLAYVQRDDAVGKTKLRKLATHSRDAAVYLPCGTRVQDRERVTVLRRRPEFAWVRTDAGVEGFIKTNYLAAAPLPAGVQRLFHGTDGAHGASILQHGLRASAGGRLGAGVYFTPDKQIATTIARHRGLQFVVECEVTTGNIFDFDKGVAGGLAKHSKTWATHGFQTAQAMHGPWAGVPTAFRELCVHDAKSVRVIKVEGYVAAPA